MSCYLNVMVHTALTYRQAIFLPASVCMRNYYSLLYMYAASTCTSPDVRSGEATSWLHWPELSTDTDLAI